MNNGFNWILMDQWIGSFGNTFTGNHVFPREIRRGKPTVRVNSGMDVAARKYGKLEMYIFLNMTPSF